MAAAFLIVMTLCLAGYFWVYPERGVQTFELVKSFLWVYRPARARRQRRLCLKSSPSAGGTAVSRRKGQDTVRPWLPEAERQSESLFLSTSPAPTAEQRLEVLVRLVIHVQKGPRDFRGGNPDDDQCTLPHKIPRMSECPPDKRW